MPGEKSCSKKLNMKVVCVVFIEGLVIMLYLLFFTAALFCSDKGNFCPKYSTIAWFVSLAISSNFYIEIYVYIVMYRITYFLRDNCKWVCHHLKTKRYESIQLFRMNLTDSMCLNLHYFFFFRSLKILDLILDFFRLDIFLKIRVN